MKSLKMLFLLWLFFAPCTPIELNDLLNELSWNLKLKLLNDVVPNKAILDNERPIPLAPYTFASLNSKTTPSILPLSAHQAKIHPSSSGLPPKVPPGVGDSRRMGSKQKQNSQPKRRDIERQRPEENADADDNDMRMKLFRLMYETVRDSDLKVKRAELIREHYINSTSFEIGYLLGDVTDKYNVMTDISTTLQRFYHDWKPIEHINAYEQIANQAIEINHLVDLIRIVNKRDAHH